MALIKDPLGRAAKASTALQAARLYQELDAELALNDSLPAGWEADAEAAQAQLRSRFPGEDLEHPDNAQGDKIGGWGPSLSRSSKRELGAGDQADDDTKDSPGPKSPAAGARARRPKSSGAGAGGSGAGRRASGRRAGSRSSRAGRGVIGAALPGPGAGQLLVTVIGGTVGLILVYVLLRSSEAAGKGSNVIDTVGRGLVSGLHVLVAPVDPLAPRSVRAKAAFASEMQIAQSPALGASSAPRAAVRPRSPQRRPTLTTH